jgi:hypothetical protein
MSLHCHVCEALKQFHLHHHRGFSHALLQSTTKKPWHQGKAYHDLPKWRIFACSCIEVWTNRSYSVPSLHLGVILSPVEWFVLEQELLTIPEHLAEFTVSFSGLHVTQYLVLCVCFVDRCLSFCTFSFGHCVVCSSIYGFGLPIWCLQTLFIILQTIEAVWANSSETTTRDLSFTSLFVVSLL